MHEKPLFALQPEHCVGSSEMQPHPSLEEVHFTYARPTVHATSPGPASGKP